MVRIAMGGLRRPGAPTATVITSPGTGLTVMIAIALIDSNLRAQIIAAVYTDPAAEPMLEKAVTDRFGNVTAIHTREALEAANQILARVGWGVRSAAAVTVLAGILVLAGAIAADRRSRRYEAVLFKVLGATRGRIARIYFIEYAVLGLVTSVVAATLGAAVAWGVVTRLMQFDWTSRADIIATTVLACTALAVLAGFAGIWRHLGEPAAPFFAQRMIRVLRRPAMQRPPPSRSHLSRRRFVGGLTVAAALIQQPGVLRFSPFSADTGRKRIYLAADDHTDYFWTADGETYRRAFLEMLDYYLDLADATEEEPAEHQSRWNCDGSVWLWTYEKNKPQADFERLIGRIKDGHVSAPLNALVVCLGGAPTEAVLRGFYYAGHLERRYDLRFVMAVAMENQTLPYGLGALWAGSGAKYSWKGICACATRVEKAGDREHDMYWMVGPDGSRVLMKWYALMAGDNRGIGGYAEARDPGAVVEFIDKDPAFTGRYPYSVIGAFGQGWDDLDTLNDAIVRAAKEKTDESAWSSSPIRSTSSRISSGPTAPICRPSPAASATSGTSTVRRWPKCRRG
jgi:hypothetical protein